MDDELEDKVFYQTYVSHMKILSKFAVGFSSINSPLAYIWKLCRLYVLRPEVIFCGLILFVLLLYLQAVDVWSRSILGRIQATLGRQKAVKMMELSASAGDHQSWEEMKQQSSAFAVLGRRPRMEDRFIIEENINNNTGISFFAVFDGHGGEFAADFAKDVLVKNIYNKIIEMSKLLKSEGGSGGALDYEKSPYLARKQSRKDGNKENTEPSATATVARKDSLRKAHSTTADCSAIKQKTTEASIADIYTATLNIAMRASGNVGAAKDSFLNNNNNNAQNGGGNPPPPSYEAKCYIENGRINFGKLITDEIMSADYKLVEQAKRATNIAGTTALIAIVQGSKLIVANVGDSRGVMYDSRGIAIPLSFDHKPQQVRERKRIHDAGGFIAFKGVWRVAGVLATSRALGDYPLKDKNLVIATPDILTFELNDHKPRFLILASDGLWDTFNNEEACTFVQEHLKESDFGAKSLAMESYKRGSVDNITVLVIVFKNDVYRIGSSSSAAAPEGKVGGEGGDNALKVPAKSQPAAVVQRSNSIKTK
ncbi:protein phosphatase 1L [Drosophila serrata]|uniref:protein phosphatase 1L n=1 Tax=Drosophila serrata TaxID=7274 RepID=UPI000A1D20C6|nr:protein phosphatase 1L [Drosophila serrata]XP_020799158.1 protein phosphatase 1L [Drosophila serrata]XP_020799159.1 protein phosphatase 1L [Drosophila serrata]